jgi:amidase
VTELHELSAAQQLQALRAREISSRELTAHYLDRIGRLDSALGAFASVTPELALDEAGRADERLAKGERAPLLGLPLGIKDLYATAGVRTTFGSAALANYVPSADSWNVGLLRKAGAVLVGKTNAGEFGATCYTYDLDGRPTVTPYAPTRYASGSSGGAAAAVAAGLVPAAHAGDGAGSTRTPAATCHLVGVKPSRGVVGVSVPSLFSTTIEGPITRTVQDAALMLDVMARPWSGDLHSRRTDESFSDAVRRAPARPLKVAAWTQTGLAGLDPHPEAAHAVDRAATLLRELGHTVQVIEIPAYCDGPVRDALVAWMAALVHLGVEGAVPADRRELLQPFIRHLYEAGRGMSGSDVLTAQAVQARYASSFLTALDEFDLALTPTTSGPPAPVGHFLADGVEAVADLMLGWSCYTPWVNLTGQPAVSVPSHLAADGLPYGVQLVGRRDRDGELLAVTAHLEKAQLWSEVHPPCWNQ